MEIQATYDSLLLLQAVCDHFLIIARFDEIIALTFFIMPS